MTSTIRVFTATSHRRAPAGLLVILLMLMPLPCLGAPDTAVVIRNANVITGDGSPLLRNRSLVIRDGRIDAILAADDPKLPQSAGVIDANGGYLLPGFVDTHVHVAMGPVGLRMDDGEPVLTMEPLPAMADSTARALLAHGVTLARDPGGLSALTVETRRKIADGVLDGPTLQVAGEVIDTSRFENLVATVEEEQEVRAEVARQAKAGVDWIKLYVGLEPELVAAAIDEAERHDVQVTGHLQATTWTRAAELGIDSLVHAMPGSPELLPEPARGTYAASMASTLHMLRWFDLADFDAPVIQEMLAALRRHEVSFDPTLIVLHSMAHADDETYTRNPALDLVSPKLVTNWRTAFNFNLGWTRSDFAAAKRLYPRAAEFVRLAFESGVTLTVGTDANNPWIVPGDSYHRELELLSAAGIPPLDVITMATRNGAELLGVLEEAGTAEVGKRADLVLVRRDPSRDISAVRDLVWVMKGGELAAASMAYKHSRETVNSAAAAALE